MNSDRANEPPNPTDWQRWVAEHTPKLLLFARQQARCEADAHDLVQEAIVECWQRRSDQRPPDLAHVFATLRRRAIDLARQADRRSRREFASEPPPDCWFDTPPEERERALMIQNALNQLPAEFRDVVTLKIWGGMTFAEIAVALDLPANTAASRYRYGLEHLRKRTKEVLA